MTDSDKAEQEREACERAFRASKYMQVAFSPKSFPPYFDGWRAALASLEAALAALPGDKGQARMLTEAETTGAFNITVIDGAYPHWMDRMESVIRKFCEVNGIALVHLAAPSSSQVPQIAGRDGASAAPSDEGKSNG